MGEEVRTRVGPVDPTCPVVGELAHHDPVCLFRNDHPAACGLAPALRLLDPDTPPAIKALGASLEREVEDVDLASCFLGLLWARLASWSKREPTSTR